MIPVSPIAAPMGDSASIKTDNPEKVREAAEQFESLLISQLLRQARESGEGWLGSGGEGSADSAFEFAEQHLATVLARQGGLGLAAMISQGLSREGSSAQGEDSVSAPPIPS